MKGNVFLVLTVLFSSSCSSQSVEEKLEECVNKRLEEEAYYAHGIENFDFYLILEKIEADLILRDALRGNSKKSYLLFIDNAFSKKKDSNFQLEIQKCLMSFERNGIDLNMYTVFSDILKYCPLESSTKFKNNENSATLEKGKIINIIEADGFESKELLKKYVLAHSKNEFSKTTYRAPTLFLICKSINQLYSKTGNNHVGAIF